jgi:hypothetical protein
MLALSLSFAIFSSSVFMMMNTLIQSEIKSVAGADLYANCVGTNSFLDQETITEFLVNSQQLGYVEDYSFVSTYSNKIFSQAKDSSSYS